MSALRPAIRLLLIVVSVLASSVFAADPTYPAPPSRPANLAPVAGYWDDRFDIPFHERWGANGGASVNAAVIFNGDLYVAGSFSDNSTSTAPHSLQGVARWDGRKWSSVGLWPPYNPIEAMVVHENQLYVTGRFGSIRGVEVNNIARWDGTSWHALGSGLTGDETWGFALESWNGDLYAAGIFSAAGGVPATNIARWDGVTWHALGDGLSAENGSWFKVTALQATSDGLYAGGAFDHSGAQELPVLARWDGAQWSAPISGLTGFAFSMDWHNGELYAGGTFALASAPEQTYNTLRWDGARWQMATAGSDPQIMVSAVRSVDGELYAATRNVAGLYRWTGTAWAPFGQPLTPGSSGPWSIRDVISYNGHLHVLGSMQPLNSTMQAKYVLEWDGTEWLGLGQGALARTYEPLGGLYSNPMVSGVAVIDGDFYISASTIKAGGRAMGNLARWDGAAWTNVNVGPPDAQASAILAVGSTLYAAGYGYDPALGRDSNFIARREAGTWTTLANNFDGRVEALAWSEGVLYAGGRFTAIGATPARGVARWDGTAWSGLGNGLLYNVKALAVANGTVYAAGATSASNTGYPDTIARWNNGAWSAIGAAMVFALEIGPDGDLYAGGGFSTIGGVQAASIARWRNGAWQPLGDGITGTVYALGFAPDGALYAGGRFRMAGSQAAANIARYDGQWSAFGALEGESAVIGGGQDGGHVRDLEATAQGVYVGGSMILADGRFSKSVAIWRPGSAPQARGDTVMTVCGQAIDIAVLGNDSDADQDDLAITGVTTPTQGLAQVVDGMVRYTPSGDYVGRDSFGYTISDGRGGTASATVTVTVAATISAIFLPTIVK
jgi:trimeric autotransporter adhesin